jgi:hypothetical protein
MAPQTLKRNDLTEDPASDVSPLPLTTALLEFAARAISFQTPGHRGGRSCRATARVSGGDGDARAT